MKAKGAAAAAAAMESSPSPYAVRYGDTKIRFKYRTLMQEYEELYKETETKRKRLQMVRKKKLALLAEVRFLRRRCKFLTQNQAQKLPPERNVGLTQYKVTGSNNTRKERIYSGNDANLQHPISQLDLNKKGDIYNEKEPMLRSLTPVFHLDQKLRTCIGNEAAFLNSATTPDLNHKERIYSEKEAPVRNNTSTFDLNQISREEEEFQAKVGALRTEEAKIGVRGGIDDQQNDMKLSACRSVGNGSNRVGKRKISWQDQVALRV